MKNSYEMLLKTSRNEPNAAGMRIRKNKQNVTLIFITDKGLNLQHRN